MITFSFEPIGHIRSPFKEKFGMPRQSGMFKSARGVLKLKDDPKFKSAIDGLETFSHIWVIFVFHQDVDKEWKSQIMPPRTEGRTRVGVFGSRSPHRPNPIGISAFKLLRINSQAKGGIEVHLEGLDLLDGTPVLDIKPYLPFADKIDEANSGWADSEIKKYPVSFSKEAKALWIQTPDEFKSLALEILELDPRPTSMRRDFPIGTPESEGKKFSFRLMNFDIRCEIRNQAVYILEILKLR